MKRSYWCNLCIEIALPFLVVSLPEFKELRLADGNYSYEGRVEVLHNNTWSTISSYPWTINEAKVVCRMLGYEDALYARDRAYFGEGDGPVFFLISEISCSGNELALDKCQGANETASYPHFPHSLDVGVVCKILDVENIGSTMINVTWKLPVHLSSALLGFQLVLTQEPASDLVEPFVFENVTLNRNEVSYTISGLEPLSEYTINFRIYSNNNIDLIVFGFIATEGGVLVRLVNGSYSFEGRLEVYYNNTWGAVGSHDWDIRGARVVCRMLGFPDVVLERSYDDFEGASDVLWLDNVQCRGNETTIAHCPHLPWGNALWLVHSPINLVCKDPRPPEGLRVADSGPTYVYIRWDPVPYRYDYKLDYIFVLTTLSVGNSIESEEVQSTNLTRLFYKSFRDHLLIKDLVPSTEYLLTARPNVTYPGYMETFVNFTFNTTAREPVSSFSPTPFEYRLSVLSFLGLIIVVVLMLLWGIIGIILIMVDMRRRRKQSLSANLKNHEEANDLIT